MFRFALTPGASLAFVGCLMGIVYSVSMMARLVIAALLIIVYMLVRPRPSRATAAWSTLALRMKPASIATPQQLRAASGGIILSFAFVDGDAWEHALSFSAPEFSKSTILVQEPHSFPPLARLILCYLGGLVQYNRQALLQLLKKKKLHGPVVVTTPRCRPGLSAITIGNKGAFSAAIKAGVPLFPAVVLHDAVHVGRAVAVGSAVPVPEAASVRALVGEFAKELAATYTSATGKELEIKY